MLFFSPAVSPITLPSRLLALVKPLGLHRGRQDSTSPRAMSLAVVSRLHL